MVVVLVLPFAVNPGIYVGYILVHFSMVSAERRFVLFISEWVRGLALVYFRLLRDFQNLQLQPRSDGNCLSEISWFNSLR